MTHDDFLAAILSSPEDDLPRLIYADWLDEGGDSARAEFIRVQVEIAATGLAECPSPTEKRRSRLLLGKPVIDTRPCGICRWCLLSAREKVLLGKHYHPWLCDLAGRATSTSSHPDLAVRFGGHPGSEWGWLKAVGFRRGFVASIQCLWSTWMECGADIIRRAPIERVELVGKQPLAILRSGMMVGARLTPDVVHWLFSDEAGSHRLPPALRPHFSDAEEYIIPFVFPRRSPNQGNGRGFFGDTLNQASAAAHTALSTALLRWARAAREAEFLPHPYVVPVLPTGELLDD